MRVASCLVILGATIGLAAQDSPVRPFESQISYVRVDMYPAKDGKPVTDLLESEIEVLEEGRRQEIVHFEHVSLGGVRPRSTRAPSADEVQRVAKDPRARVFVLFLDPRHVDVQGSMAARRPLIDALNALIGGDDLIAVMTPEMSPRALTFTRRTGSIEQLLETHWGTERWVGSRDPVEASYESCYDNPVIIGGSDVTREMILRRREVLVLDALENLVVNFGGLREERKAVITISDGWQLYGPDRTLTRVLFTKAEHDPRIGQLSIPVPPLGTDPTTGRPSARDRSSGTMTSDGTGTNDRSLCESDRIALSALTNEHRFVEIMQSANRANISFYPVGPGGFSQTYRPLGARMRSLRLMADTTDGMAIVQPSGLESGLRRVVDDLNSYYLLGYYSDAKPDGRYRRISVRTTRPGVQIRARRGYLAARVESTTRAVPDATSPESTNAQIISQAMGRLSASSRQWSLQGQAAVAWTSTGSAVVRVVAEVPRTMATGDDWSKGGEIDAALVDANGRGVADGQLQLTPGTFVAELNLLPGVPLAPGEYTLRLRARGAAVVSPGADDLEIVLPAAPVGAGVVLSRRGPATGNREVLTADARFRRAERLVMEFPASSAGTFKAVLLDRTGKPLPIPVTTNVREDAQGLRWDRAEVVLAPLGQGDYLIEWTSGDARRLTAFRVVP